MNDFIRIEGTDYPLLQALVPHKQSIERKIKETNFHKNVFLMMKYRDYNKELSDYIVKVFKEHKLNCIRADMAAWNLTGDSVLNPLAVLYCCKYGVALFDEPEDGQHFGPNVAYELAIMHYQWKNCLTLIHQDLHNKKPFDIISKMHYVYNTQLSVANPIKEWIRSNHLKNGNGNGKKSNEAAVKAKAEKKQEVKMMECETRITIADATGDCAIIEHYKVKSKTTTTYKHYVELFSFDNSMNWTTLGLQALGADDKPVEIQQDRDLPNSKTFFLNIPLIKNKDSRFMYRYKWSGMFPKEEESYTLLMHADYCIFTLEYPASWCNVVFKVIDADSREEVKPTSLMQETKTEQPGKCSFEFNKRFKGKRIRIEWVRNH